jgi:hypothetical protein
MTIVLVVLAVVIVVVVSLAAVVVTQVEEAGFVVCVLMTAFMFLFWERAYFRGQVAQASGTDRVYLVTTPDGETRWATTRPVDGER